MVHESLPARSGRRRERRTEDFLHAAMALVEAEGIEGLTIARLARELDLAVGAMYRYFPSKDDLVAALEVRVLDEYIASLQTAMQALPPPTTQAAALVRLLVAPRHYHAHLVERPAVRRLLSLALADPRRLVADGKVEGIIEACQRLALALGALFQGAVSAGALPDAPVLPRVLVYFAQTQGIVQLEKILARAGGMPAVTALLDGAVAALLVGFGARPGVVEKAQQLSEGFA